MGGPTDHSFTEATRVIATAGDGLNAVLAERLVHHVSSHLVPTLGFAEAGLSRTPYQRGSI